MTTDKITRLADARARDLLASVVFPEGGAGSDVVRDQSIPQLGQVPTQSALRAIAIALQQCKEGGVADALSHAQLSAFANACDYTEDEAYGTLQLLDEAIAKHPPAHFPYAGQGVSVLRIPRSDRLDPIFCYFEDFEPGAGRLTVACFGDAWTGAWGAMGDRTVRRFVAECGADDLSSSLLQLRGANKNMRDYTTRIAAAVIAALRPPKMQEATPNG